MSLQPGQFKCLIYTLVTLSLGVARRLAMLMKIFFLFVVLSFLFTNSFAGNNESVKTMANIMMHLNHFPSDSEKRQLMNLRNSSDSESIKVIANAMINLQHSASSRDKPLLEKVMKDSSAPQQIRDLASIIYNINHKPSNSDKQKLSTMINFADNN